MCAARMSNERWAVGWCVYGSLLLTASNLDTASPGDSVLSPLSRPTARTSLHTLQYHSRPVALARCTAVNSRSAQAISRTPSACPNRTSAHGSQGKSSVAALSQSDSTIAADSSTAPLLGLYVLLLSSSWCSDACLLPLLLDAAPLHASTVCVWVLARAAPFLCCSAQLFLCSGGSAVPRLTHCPPGLCTASCCPSLNTPSMLRPTTANRQSSRVHSDMN